jgi:hypothetical protein
MQDSQCMALTLRVKPMKWVRFPVQDTVEKWVECTLTSFGLSYIPLLIGVGSKLHSPLIHSKWAGTFLEP